MRFRGASLANRGNPPRGTGPRSPVPFRGCMLKTRLSKVNNPRAPNPLGDKGAPETRRWPNGAPRIRRLAETLWVQGIQEARSSKPGSRRMPFSAPWRFLEKVLQVSISAGLEDHRIAPGAPAADRFALGNRLRDDGARRARQPAAQDGDGIFSAASVAQESAKS